MKLSKIEIEGKQEEVTQFLNASGHIEGLNFNVDETCDFFRDNFLNNAASEIVEKNKAEKKMNESAKTSTQDFNSKVAFLTAHIFSECKNNNFTVNEILDVANRLISYANKKICRAQTK